MSLGYSHGYSPRNLAAQDTNRGVRETCTLHSVLLATAVGASRVYLGEHSSAQVAVGSAVGAAVGVAWYALFCAVLRPLLLPLLEHPLARYFYLRDASRVADALRQEYEWHRAFALTKAR